MRTSFLGLVAAAYLAGCGGGDDGPAAPGFDPGAPGADSIDPGPSEAPIPEPVPDPSAEAGGEGMPPDLGLDLAAPAPTTPDTSTPELPPGIQFGNGRIIDGSCTLVCADASTDPDAAGV